MGGKSFRLGALSMLQTPHLPAKLARAARDRAGGVAVVFAIAVIPILALIGAAVDYGSLLSRRAKLQTGVDYAALAAAQAAAKTIAAGGNSWNGDGIQAAHTAFRANLSTESLQGLTIDLSETSGVVTASLRYAETVNSGVMAMLGAQASRIAVAATATSGATSASAGNYVDLHIVMDVSAPMGVGADIGDQQKMANDASVLNCTLACHTKSVHYSPIDSDTLAASRALGVRKRIDVVRDSVVAALTDVKTANPGGNVRVALYAMSNSLTTIFGLSSDLTSAVAIARSVDLTGEIYQGGSNISYSLQTLNGLVTASGTGVSAASPKTVVMLITGGVQNSNRIVACGRAATVDPRCSAHADATDTMKDPNWLGNISPSMSFPAIAGNPVIQPIDPSYCAPIKKKGARMLTLEVKYVIPTVGAGLPEARYDFIKTIAPNVAANMQSCASAATDSLSASDSAAIDSAIVKMIVAATPGGDVSTVHLTR